MRNIRSIADTVRESLAQQGLQQYQTHARPTVAALEDRERDLATQIIEYAAEQGVERETARTALEGIGMTVPVPVPVGSLASAQQANEGGDVAVMLARIATQLDGLTQFARDNGYTG